MKVISARAKERLLGLRVSEQDRGELDEGKGMREQVARVLYYLVDMGELERVRFVMKNGQVVRNDVAAN